MAQKFEAYLMNNVLLSCATAVLTLAGGTALSAVEWKENDRGVVGYDDTPQLPWTPYRKHDRERPLPRHVEAKAVLLAPPGDATVLFDGRSLEAWKPSAWQIQEGALVAGKGDLETIEAFGSFQLHLEFMTPEEQPPYLGDRGNSGVFPMKLYEIQIFDSHPMHRVQIYADGQCAAIYGETPPRVNASAKPGVWQSYDLIFVAPRFDAGRLIEPARVTLLHNGVVVHVDEEVRGKTGHRALGSYEAHADRLPLKLQGHGSPVKFRNIWIRPLP